MGAVSSVDEFQRRHPVLGFPLAVVYKYFDDQGPYLASALTYYAFIAIFPLMLLGTSILGIILRGEPNWQEAILDSALAQFPIIGDELGRPEGLQGSFAGVAVGGVAALYGAMGLGQALQNTQHVAWSVPRNSRPNPFYARVKTLVLLVTAGFSLLAVSIVSTVASTTDVFTEVLGHGHEGAAPGAHHRGRRHVPHAPLPLRRDRPALVPPRRARRLHPRADVAGAAVAGAAYVDRVLVDTTSMTKTFGLVLGLIGFLWIGAVMAVLAMEINVVLARRLWPRALLTPFTDNVQLTDADRRAYASYARMQRHKGFEKVSVVVGAGPRTSPSLERSRADRPTGRRSVDGSTRLLCGAAPRRLAARTCCRAAGRARCWRMDAREPRRTPAARRCGEFAAVPIGDCRAARGRAQQRCWSAPTTCSGRSTCGPRLGVVQSARRRRVPCRASAARRHADAGGGSRPALRALS